ncbi:hypothetical protein LOD99_2472 [Oopsacas minuta]|uniref:Ig-like domain-containing protein n=1 Tax=Oopsacas minuta TaxID=111878 RepID=A0AAV7K1S4_9METZ|nr:hypothetical protein LOD99_2472 [Oopsacas minuta]
MGTKISWILVICVLVAFLQNANTGEILAGNGETYKLIGISTPRVTIGDNAIVSAGASVELRCPVSTVPDENPIIDWNLNDNRLEYDGFNVVGYPNIRRYTEMSLSIYNVTENEAAKYCCILTFSVAETKGVIETTACTELQIAPNCPDGCRGVRGGKGYPGSRGQEGAMGRPGLPGICYPEECPKPETGVKGEKGAPGPNGERGPPGVNGDVGAPGDDGPRGQKGNDGDMGARGDQGGQGDAGDPGADGSPGVKGEPGEEGERGDGGPIGMKGDPGDQGPTGTGPPGEVGDDGEIGSRGDNGDQGRKGTKGSKGVPGDKGDVGSVGNQGVKGETGSKGPVGMRIIIKELNSTFNSDCSDYELGQIVYDTSIDRFVYCDGNTFQCIRDRPCFDECDPNEEPTFLETEAVPAMCTNLIYVIDESASMGPEHIWLSQVSEEIDIALTASGFVSADTCTNYYGVLRFGADRSLGVDHIGRILDLGGITYKGQFLNYWGTSEELTNLVNASQFLAAGRLEDGYAAIYRALQQYKYIYPACRKVVLITDEDRDNLTPTPDPTSTRIPTLLNQNMAQTLNTFSIVLSAIVHLNITVNPSYGIDKDRILAILPNDVILYLIDDDTLDTMSIPDGIQLTIPDASDQTQNTRDTYYEMVRATGGILWSLPVSRAFRTTFTKAFLIYEIIPNVPIRDEPPPENCEVVGCQNCSCTDGTNNCDQIEVLDFDTTNQCRPTECNMTQIISGFRRASCVDMVFAVAETSAMGDIHNNVKDVAGRLVRNLAEINFGQENSLCLNQYCLMTFGQDNDRVPEGCYGTSFPISPQDLCGTSVEITPLIVGFEFEASGFSSDGYAAIYSALRRYPAEFQDQSCRHITLITNGPRANCGSFRDGNIIVPELDRDFIEAELAREEVILNVIVDAQFEDGEGNAALGIYKDTDGSIKALVVISDPPGYEERAGGKVKENSAGSAIDIFYVMLALSRGGSAWDIEKMGSQTDAFTKAFVNNVVVRSSLACGQREACVECRCVSGTLQPCQESSACIRGEPPILEWTSGNTTITTDNVVVNVGGFGNMEERVYYGLDGDLVTMFTIGSRLRAGTQPVTTSWYYVDVNGNFIPIEQSIVANYASVSETNPYNLVFSQVGDNIAGSYVLIAENAFGNDTQFTTIGILPKWDKTISGTVTGTQAQFGQTLVARTGSELRITGIVREGTRPWSFQWFYGGVELIQGVDYSFEYVGNTATIIIHNFQSNGAGEYTSIVRNRYGEDIHTFNLIVQTVVSCDNNPDSTSTICSNCDSNIATKQATLTLFAHSFSLDQEIQWHREINNNLELIRTDQIVSGPNQLVVPIRDLCIYKYQAVVTGLNRYEFECPCNDCVERGVERDGAGDIRTVEITVECCGASQTLLTESDCGEDFFADILLIIDVSASMDTEHEFLRSFLPRFESSLRESCVGNSTINQNQYTAVAFGSIGDKENPYFVGPNLDRGGPTDNVYFTIDMNDDSNVTKTIKRLPKIGEREDGFAATNFAKKYAQIRPNSLRFAILVTDERRDFFYDSFEEIEAASSLFNNFVDFGRSLYVDLFTQNNIIPIQIIDVTLTATDDGGSSIDCLGVSSAETCFYRVGGSQEIFRLENTEVINTVDNSVREEIHNDYLQTALNATGYVWDLKVIRRNETGNWDAITDALTSEVLVRAREELTQCRNCECFPGGRECTIVSVDQQARCKCEKNFPNNTEYCDCILGQVETIDYCRCRYIDNLEHKICNAVGTIELTYS